VTAPVVLRVGDREQVAGLLGRDPALHAYELGDLEDLLWPDATFYRCAGQVALLYRGGVVPLVLALTSGADRQGWEALLRGLVPVLPSRFEAHLSPGGRRVWAGVFRVRWWAAFRKMRLAGLPPQVPVPAGMGVSVLTDADVPGLRALYAAAYPGCWFDERLVGTGGYVGVRGPDGGLLSVAGVHVYSPRRRVAAVGNVATVPWARGRGLARLAVGVLGRRLSESVEHVTLNVRADNRAAVRLYEGLGFVGFADYEEAGFSVR
jgi:RimJ/RimL family protein N-acetyltransferase